MTGDEQLRPLPVAGVSIGGRSVSEHHSAVIPAGWVWKESMTLLAPTSDANIIFSGEPIDSGISTEQYAKIQSDVLQNEFPEYREIVFEKMLMLGGREGWMRRFEWQPPEGERVTQIQLYCVDLNRGYTATATAPAAKFPLHSATLIQILESLRIEDGPTAEGSPSDPIDVGSATTLNDNSDASQYEVRVDGEVVGIAPYQWRPGLIAIPSIDLDERFEGRGVANDLVVGVLEDARKRGLKVLPFAPLVNSYIQSNPEYADLVPEDQRAAFEVGSAREGNASGPSTERYVQ